MDYALHLQPHSPVHQWRKLLVDGCNLVFVIKQKKLEVLKYLNQQLIVPRLFYSDLHNNVDEVERLGKKMTMIYNAEGPIEPWPKPMKRIEYRGFTQTETKKTIEDKRRQMKTELSNRSAEERERRWKRERQS